MTLQEIQALIDRFERSSMHTMKVSMPDFSLELSRGQTTVGTEEVHIPSPAAVQSPVRSETSGELLRAPLVGTFYSAPSPDQPAYVSPGDRVSAGQTVCLIEAMKMMSEVTSPCDCIIEEILAENGALLEFDAPILRYRKV